MATTPLIPKQISATMQNVAMTALGINPPDPSKVRVEWQTLGQPTGKSSDDILYLRCIEVDDQYDRIRDEIDIQVDSATVGQLVQYTRVWGVFWCFVGPNSFDRARILKSALLVPNQTIHDLLTTANLYLVTDIEAPRRVPEEYASQWWERVDLETRFNEGVGELSTVNAVASVEVKVYTERAPDINHPTLDFWVPPSAAPAVLPSIPSGIDFSSPSGTLQSQGQSLTDLSSLITAYSLNNTNHFGSFGSIAFSTPPVLSGSLAAGASFGSGGSLVITTPNLPYNFTGTFTSLTWTLITLANGSHYYELSGFFSGAQGSGNFVIVTSNVGNGFWPGSASITTFNLTFN